MELYSAGHQWNKLTADLRDLQADEELLIGVGGRYFLITVPSEEQLAAHLNDPECAETAHDPKDEPFILTVHPDFDPNGEEEDDQ